MEQEKEERLGIVDELGEIVNDIENIKNIELLEEYINRKDFYSGKATNKHICGVVFWIFDKQGNLLLAERGAGKEQGAGKISPPSGHMQYKRADDEREIPIQACFNEVEEELGLSCNYENFPFLDGYFPVGAIHRPGGSAENCMMIVKHYAFMMGDGVKNKIRNNEAKRIFFESWDTAKGKFGIDDNTLGAYQFFGTNKMEILNELDGFVHKITLLDTLGPDAIWDTVALNDCEAIEQYGRKMPESKNGYVNWEIISTKEDLINEVAGEDTIWETIRAKENLSYEDIEDIVAVTGKVITMRKEDIIAIGEQHTSHDFSEIISPQSEIDNIVKMTRMIGKKRDEPYK